MITRRTLIGSGLALAAFPAVAGAAAPARVKITTYRSPSCGCCGKWVDAARSAGFDVAVVMVDDIMALKEQHGIPKTLLSCHTSLAGGYVVEGHVPFHAVRKLLKDKPRSVKGIAVPGMPMGAPGMEHGDHKEPFDVLAFDAGMNVSVFTRG
jgi:hypothetical protein